jgi:hypothetical protein
MFSDHSITARDMKYLIELKKNRKLKSDNMLARQDDF